MVVCENGRASFDGTVAQRTAWPLSGRCPPTVSPPALWAPSWPWTRPPRPPSLCVPPLLLSRLCFHSSALSSSHNMSLTALSSPHCPTPPPPSWSRAANEEPRLVWLTFSGGCVQRRPASALVTGCWGCDITQGPAVDLVLSPRLAGLMAGGRYSSSPPSSSCSLSLSVTPTPPRLRPFTLPSPLAFSLSQAREQAGGSWLAAEERAGRRLQPPLSNVAPPLPWKLSGRVAAGMEGRAAGQVGLATASLFRRRSHRFFPFPSSCLFYFLTFSFA